VVTPKATVHPKKKVVSVDGKTVSASATATATGDGDDETWRVGSPAWSPSGDELIYSGYDARYPLPDLYSVAIDENGDAAGLPTQLTTDPAWDGYPRSPRTARRWPS
jgi:Tol biopolymer transport system component